VLVACRWTYPRKAGPGRPSVEPEVEKLVLKLLEDHPGWGSDRIVGALSNLHIQISDSTVDSIRERNGIPPGTRAHQEDDLAERKFLPGCIDSFALRDGRDGTGPASVESRSKDRS
jgi:hypothetical protein